MSRFICEIKLGREYYPLQSEIYRWLKENLVPYDEQYPLWDYQIMFGYQTIKFTSRDDLSKFKWRWAVK